MAHLDLVSLDLVWPAAILVGCFAAAIAVRTVAAHADRVSRERSRKWLREVWQEGRGPAVDEPDRVRTSPPKSK